MIMMMIIIMIMIEIECKWNVKTKVIPIKIGATGNVSKSFRSCLKNILRKDKIKKLRETAIFGTARTLRKL